MLIDLHVHSSYSDDYETSVEQAVESCKARGIDAIALVEFDLVPDLEAVQAESKRLEYPIFVGIDIDADDGRLLAFPRDPTDDWFVKMSWDTGDDELKVQDIVNLFRDKDGACIASHPYLDDGGPFLGDRVYRIEGLCGLEVACGVKKMMCNDMALEAAFGMGLPTIGGSDSGPEGQRLGSYATAFAESINNQSELVSALQQGEFWAAEIGNVGAFRSSNRRPHRGRGRGRGRGRNSGPKRRHSY